MEPKNEKVEKVKWTTSMEVFLIDNFHERRMLWDVHHPYYFKKGIKKKNMEDIVNKLKEVWPHETKGLKADTVRQKFANLRTYFLRELKKKHANQNYHSKWDHFQRMQFMCKTIQSSDSRTSSHPPSNSYSSEVLDDDDSSSEDDTTDPLNMALKALHEAREDPQDRAYWFVNFMKCEIRSFSDENQSKLINELLSTLINFRERLGSSNSDHTSNSFPT